MSCYWCYDPDANTWSPTLCREHQAEWEGLSEFELEEMDSALWTEWYDNLL